MNQVYALFYPFNTVISPNALIKGVILPKSTDKSS
jgi:hypothetical protein